MFRQSAAAIRLFLTAAVLCAAGCASGGSNSAAEDPVSSPAPALAQLPGMPPLPADEPPPGNAQREASVNINTVLDGVDFYSTNAIPDSISSLQLRPDDGKIGPLAWAIYRFPGLSADANVITLSAALSGLSTSEDYYFALADYSIGGWRMFTRSAALTSQTWNFAANFSAANNISPNSNVFLAVLTYEQPADVDFVTLQASTSLAAPQNLTASDATNPDAVQVTWDVVPGAQMYEVFYKEAGQPDDFYGFLTQTTGDTDTPGFFHTADDPAGKPAVYGTEYEYKVRATADGEDPSPFSAPDSGVRRLPAPYFMYATDRIGADRIFLAWRMPLPDSGLHDFELNVDGAQGSLPDLGQVGNSYYYNYLPGDLAQHEYFAVDTGTEGDSLPSPTDAGSAGEWNDVLVDAGDSNEIYYADMEPAVHDPSVPAVCFNLADAFAVQYGWIEGATVTAHQVVQADVDGTLALTNFDGRPWIAINNRDEAYGAVGIYVARGKVAQPQSSDDWDVYLVSPGTIGSNNVALEVIGGRLALAYTEFAAVSDYTLHYAYALIDDPQGTVDWADTTVATNGDNHLTQQVDLIEWQGLPLVAGLGSEGGRLNQASSLAPLGESDWTTYTPPLNGGESGLGEGLDLAVDDGRLYLATLQGGAESPCQMIVTWPTSWPPASFSWSEHVLLERNDVNFGGLSLIFDESRPFLAWASGEDFCPRYAFPLIIDEDELTWNTQQWGGTQPEPDPKYDRAEQEVTIRMINGEPAMLYVCRYFDGHYMSDLLFSQILPPPS